MASAARQAVDKLPDPLKRVLRTVRDRVRSASGEQRQGEGQAKKGPAGGVPKKLVLSAPVSRERERLFNAVSRGLPLTRAVEIQVRSLIKAQHPDQAFSLALSLRKDPSTATAGNVGVAIIALHRAHYALAWDALRQLPQEVWIPRMPSEYVRQGLKQEPERIVAELAGVIDEASEEIPVQAWFEIAAGLFGHGDTDLSRRAFAHFDRQRAAYPEQWKPAERLGDWLAPWLASTPESPSADAPDPGVVSFALVDYRHPDGYNASINVGDPVQTLASLGHLVRHSGLSFEGSPESAALLTELQRGVPDELRLDSGEHRVHLSQISRDASRYDPIPPNTWALVFGWFMHPIFGQSFGVPMHQNLRPIIVSFHCNNPGLLSTPGIEYLRTYSPIGCRDWTTVDLLLSLDIPAFFSGCLTTTVSTVFPTQEPASTEAPVADVEAPAGRAPVGSPKFVQAEREMRQRSFAENVEYVRALLDNYRTNFSKVATSRLHAYLPSRSLGMNVDFQPKNRADIRFAGLIDIDQSQFDAIRTRLLQVLAPVIGAIVQGAPSEDVYAQWRALTADATAEARHRFAQPATVAELPRSVREHVLRIRSTARTEGPVGGASAGSARHLVLQPTLATIKHVAALVSSITAGTSDPLHVWILAGADVSDGLAALAAQFPTVTFTSLNTDGLGDDLQPRNTRRVPRASIELLLLPDLLVDIDRVVVLPVASVVAGDLGELADLDLGEHALGAATDAVGSPWTGLRVIYEAALRLGTDPAAAAELRRRHLHRNSYGFPAFSSSVLVLDLAKMRADGFVADFVPYVQAYGLDARETLTLAFGGRRAAIPTEWAYAPTRDPHLADAKLTYWPDAVKPWHGAFYTAGQEAWHRANTSARA